MMRMNWNLSPIVLVLLAIPAAAERPSIPAPDAYGYTVAVGGEPGCSHHYLDLMLSGEAVDLVASGVEPAGDDGGAELTLPMAFEFYGTPATSLVVSSNGYLAPAADLEDEDGGHWRADCPLPAIPDNAHARFGRIYALLDDLEQGSAGQLFWQHFPDCPRASGVQAAEACTVVHWRNWRRLGGSDPLDFQVLLYHSSMAIAMQYREVAAAVAGQATIGVQDQGAVSAALVGCAGSMPPKPGTSFCLFDPRHPPVGTNDEIFANGFEAGH